MLISFPSKNLMEGEFQRLKKGFFFLLFFSRSRLSLGRGWSACLIAGWGWGSCRCWRRLKRERWRQPGTERCWTWTPMGRWWRRKEMDRKCGRERSSRRWRERGKKTLERGRRWWVKDSWRQAKRLIPTLLLLPLILTSLLSCLSAAGESLCASFSHHCGQTCVRRFHRRRASHQYECGCVLSDGHCGWSCACRCGIGRVSGLCGCECDVSTHQSVKSGDRRSPRGKHRAFREEVSCSAGWGTCACDWA